MGHAVWQVLCWVVLLEMLVMVRAHFCGFWVLVQFSLSGVYVDVFFSYGVCGWFGLYVKPGYLQHRQH